MEREDILDAIRRTAEQNGASAARRGSGSLESAFLNPVWGRYWPPECCPTRSRFHS